MTVRDVVTSSFLATKYTAQDLSTELRSTWRPRPGPKPATTETIASSVVTYRESDRTNNRPNRKSVPPRFSGSGNNHVRFAVGLQRLIPFIGYHHVLMIILVITIIVVSLLLAGCQSSLTGIWLASMSAQNPAAASSVFQVRVGYFGLCISSQAGGWICSSDTASLFDIQQSQANFTSATQVLGVGRNIRDQILFPYFLVVSNVMSVLVFLLLATFPGWHEERDEVTGEEVDIKPFPSRPVSQVALFFALMSTLLLLVTAVWQHVGVVSAEPALRPFAPSDVTYEVGAAALALGWLAFALNAVVAMGLFVLILSIVLLDRLTDD